MKQRSILRHPEVKKQIWSDGVSFHRNYAIAKPNMKINQNQPTNKITYRGVFPSESCMLTDALCRRRICIIFRLPLAAALCNGVDSKWSVASGSAPFSRSMIAIWRHRKRKRGKKNEEKFIITKHFFWEQHQLQQHRQPYLLLIFGGCVVQGRAAVLIDSIDGSPLVNEGLHDLIAARRCSNVQGSPTSLQRQARKLLKQRYHTRKHHPSAEQTAHYSYCT